MALSYYMDNTNEERIYQLHHHKDRHIIGMHALIITWAKRTLQKKEKSTSKKHLSTFYKTKLKKF